MMSRMATETVDDWTPGSTQTLAELYAALDGFAQRPAERLVGFAR
jgi:hypothetical protein